MESEDAALWRAVVADPHDDAPRLIYADWLDDHDQTDRAEFIRVQCRLARLDDDAPERTPLEQRERHLWLRNKSNWRAAFPAGLRAFPFRRGFVYPRNLHLTARQFLRHRAIEFAAAPLSDVKLYVGGPADLDMLYGSDRLRRLDGLMLDGTGLSADGLAAFLNAPELDNVRALGLRGGPASRDHVWAVSSTPTFDRLTRLSIFSNSLGLEGAEVLAGAKGLRHLEVLELVHCGLGDAGLRTLLASPHLSGLKELRVPANGLTASAIRALVACRHLRGLRVLDLQGNHLDDDGARVLSLCPAVDRLTRLDLGWNRIHRPGAESLAASPFLARVRQLCLLGNPCAYDPATVTGLRFRFSDRVTLTER